MIRILIVDDHPVVREGLAAVLNDEPDLEVVGAADSAEAAEPLVFRLRPDVVLLDLELPGLDGVAALPRLRTGEPAPKVLVFTAYDTDERVVGAVRAGASGYLLKGAPADEIARAIRAVRDGGTYLAPRVAAKLVAELRPERGTRPSLTERERAVLRLVADGLPSKQVARALGISERTVKFHVASILQKLGAENRAQAVALAAERGLL